MIHRDYVYDDFMMTAIFSTVLVNVIGRYKMSSNKKKYDNLINKFK